MKWQSSAESSAPYTAGKTKKEMSDGESEWALGTVSREESPVGLHTTSHMQMI